MESSKLNQIYRAELSDKEFELLSDFIYSNYGIKMPAVKRIMLQSRLQKRLRELNISSFHEYCEFLFSDEGHGNEVIHMIDLVSTNKTDFYREPVHFEFLQKSVLPAFVEKHKNGKTIRIWSAGCSSGEEPYTIAMAINDAYNNKYPGFDYAIYATDISTRVLKAAKNGVFKQERISGIPLDTIKKYFLKSKDPEKKLVRIIPEIRNKVNFQRLNFMDKAYHTVEKFDVIFCRNVLIYFDRETQEQVINKLCQQLKPGGYFFLGHSESITNISVPLQQIKPTIFMRL